MRSAKSVSLLAIIAGVSPAMAQEEMDESVWDSRGELALEGRLFRDDADGRTEDLGLGLFGRLELSHDHGAFSERVRGFGRLDARDDQRTTLIVEEAWAQLRSGALRVRAGVDLVNWTALEAFHPADVLNARNLDGDLESYEKLGEPMVTVALSLPTDTTVEAIALPYHSAPAFTSPRSRLSLVPPGLELGERIMLDRDGAITTRDFGPQAALRIRQVAGGADLSVHAIEHLDRSEPAVVFDLASGRARPVFQTVRQVGGTVQHVFDALIVKVEAAYRSFVPASPDSFAGVVALPDRDHGVVAAGLEYGLVFESGTEATFVLEGQAVLGLDRPERVMLQPFQRDVLAGVRLALNDEESRELLVTGILDLDGEGEGLLGISYSQRIGETWSLRAGARLIEAGAPGPFPTGLRALRDADSIRLSLTRHF